MGSVLYLTSTSTCERVSRVTVTEAVEPSRDDVETDDSRPWSLSRMVMREVGVAITASMALRSFRSKVSLGSEMASLVIGSVMVILVVPGGKVMLLAKTVKSALEAVPDTTVSKKSIMGMSETREAVTGTASEPAVSATESDVGTEIETTSSSTMLTVAVAVPMVAGPTRVNRLSEKVSVASWTTLLTIVMLTSLEPKVPAGQVMDPVRAT
mmetsp:Transcript_9901/g.22292  ORF Transcript_9901/g.22292 Transcript_9901/m.22292 type:complete len:211 (+) Transcript_9901:399-1031(+)